MKFYKSSWFWFLVVWLVLSAVALFVVRAKLPGWSLWHGVGLAVDLLAGTGVTLLLWQRSRMRSLSKGLRQEAADKFEEQWRSAMRTDFQRLLAATPSQEAGAGLSRVRLNWLVCASHERAMELVTAGGGVDITLARSHELDGEFSQVGTWCSLGKEIVLVLRTLPDAKVAASQERVAFLMSLLKEAGKVRPVDAAVALVPVPSAGVQLPVQIQPALASLAELSCVEFPVHVLFDRSETLPGGESFYRLLESAGVQELPGAALAYSPQDKLPEALEEAWTGLRSDLDTKLQAMLLEGWLAGGNAPEILGFTDSLASAAEPVKATLKAVCGQFIGKSVPFLRSFSFLGHGKLPAAAGALPDFLGGTSFFEPSSSLETHASELPAAAAAPACLIAAFWVFLADEPDLARLSSQKQRSSSLVATALLAASFAVSALLFVAAIHGFLKGGALDSAWQKRLQQAEDAQWSDSASIHSRIGVWGDLRDLAREIRDERPWSLAPGFYRDGARLPQVEARLDTMTMRLARFSYIWQEQRLQARVSAITDSLSDTKELYGALKNYLLITREGWTVGKETEGVRGLADAWIKSWGGYLGYEGGVLPQLERDVLPKFAEDLAGRIGAGDTVWLGRENETLVERARYLLRNSKNQSGNYARLLGSADSLKDLTLDSLGIPQAEFVCKPLIIPKAFTKRAYRQAILPSLEAMAGNGTDWVVGKAQGSDTTSRSAASEVLDEMRRRYYEDYEKAWQGALTGVSCELPDENQKIATALSTLASPYNPQNPKGLQAFLKRVSDETDLAAGASAPSAPKLPLPAGAAKAVAGAQKIAGAVSAELAKGAPDPEGRLKERFATVRAVSEAASKGELDIYLKDINQLAGLFSQWSQGDGAFQFAKGIAEKDQKNPLVHATNEIKAKIEPLPVDQHAWFESLSLRFLEQIGVRLAPQSGSHVATLYKEKVFNPWQNLTRGNFPFDAYGAGEASIAEIDAVLNPKTGSFSSFLKDLEGMLTVDERSAEGSLPASRAAKDALQKLVRLQNFFYGKNGTVWKGCQITLSLRGDPRAKVGFRAGSQSLDLPTGSGEKRITLRWPTAGQTGAGVQATTLSNSFEEHKEGEWALLRLVEPRVTSGTQSSAEAMWSFSDRSYIVDISVSVRIEHASGNPFREKDFFLVNLPTDLNR